MIDGFVGQERWQKYFDTAIGVRLAHAYLFVGPRRVGKKTFMSALARPLLCMSPEGLQACGNCLPCSSWRGEVHPDVVVLSPDEKSTIGIEEARAFTNDLYRSGSTGTSRVALIHHINRATGAAANALLKLLEEPPSGVIVLARTEDDDQLPATLRSRFQVCRFAPVDVVSLSHLLQARGLANAEATTRARASRGCPGRAIRMLERVDDYRAEAAQAKMFLEAVHGTLHDKFAFTETLATEEKCSRHDLERSMDAWIEILRDAYLTATNSGDRVQHQAFREEYAELVEDRSAGHFASAVSDLLLTKRAVRQFANRRLALNTFFLHL